MCATNEREIFILAVWFLFFYCCNQIFKTTHIVLDVMLFSLF